ncbi:hypothetical protein [Nocardioides sp. W7]|uniref:hypothetical protein n=1 Tax=Nocardioides sp. W7 TaxID=2931390 RepID=UPI001FD14BBE|nr:hypothetical protein [Nocardioides sp. W7]
MIRLLLRTIVFLASAAIGLVVASLVLDEVTVTTEGFLLVVVIFAVIQTVISPFLARVAAKNATALLGGVGLLATFVALLVVTVWGDAVTIEGGVATWIAATVIVWLATALATLLLPVLLVVGRRKRRDAGSADDGPALRRR